MVGLIGELGAGKTVFTKGIARAFGIDHHVVVSPTYAIMNVYDGKLFPLYHLDLYRIENDSDILETGFYDFAFKTGVTIMEWYDKLKEELPRPDFIITLTVGSNNTREILIESYEEKTT